jgi:anti-sigma regulatory factor (Ser/Thr protein kinase)
MVESSCTFPSDLGQLTALRTFLDAACRRAWSVEADDERLCQLELAAHEAVTNIIRHAYQGQPGRPIHLLIEADDETARVTLSHYGRDFDPDAVPAPDIEGNRFGGFGLYLIGQLVDEVAYTRDDEGRLGIRLFTRRKPSQEAAAAQTQG